MLKGFKEGMELILKSKCLILFIKVFVIIRGTLILNTPNNENKSPCLACGGGV